VIPAGVLRSRDRVDEQRRRFEEGQKAIARGEYFDGSPAELVGRICERIESLIDARGL
jgi:hypothetical protein